MGGPADADAGRLEQQRRCGRADHEPLHRIVQPIDGPAAFGGHRGHEAAHDGKIAWRKDDRVDVAGGGAGVELQNHHATAEEQQVNDNALDGRQLAEAA
jgi:hypothetical protein